MWKQFLKETFLEKQIRRYKRYLNSSVCICTCASAEGNLISYNFWIKDIIYYNSYCIYLLVNEAT